MSYYEDIYLKRLNRYGADFQSRLQGQREQDFENKLLKSVYRIDFDYLDQTHPGTLEPYRQDESQTLQHLLTKVDLNLPNGTILMLPDKDGSKQPWLVYWLESMKASGYNRYIVLKMTHLLSWTDRTGQQRKTWAYMYGQEDNMLKDEIRSRSRMDTLYAENLKMSFFVIPTNEFLRKDDYLEVGSGALKEAFTVTGYDIQSNQGVEFVTVDPVYIRDHTPDVKDESSWLDGEVM